MISAVYVLFNFTTGGSIWSGRRGSLCLFLMYIAKQFNTPASWSSLYYRTRAIFILLLSWAAYYYRWECRCLWREENWGSSSVAIRAQMSTTSCPPRPQARFLQKDDDPAYVRYDAARSQSERTSLSSKVIVIMEAGYTSQNCRSCGHVACGALDVCVLFFLLPLYHSILSSYYCLFRWWC